MQEFWTRITGFGNSALTLPLAFAVAAYLALVLRRRRLAVALILAAVGGAALTVLALKMAFRLGDVGGGRVTSPSGHAAMSAVVYGCLALLVSRDSPHRPPILAAAAAFIAAIAFSRVELGAHTAIEVAAGLAVGAAFAAGFGLMLRREPPGPLRWQPLLPIAAVVAAATYGLNPPVEETIKTISGMIVKSLATLCG